MPEGQSSPPTSRQLLRYIQQSTNAGQKEIHSDRKIREHGWSLYRDVPHENEAILEVVGGGPHLCCRFRAPFTRPGAHSAKYLEAAMVSAQGSNTDSLI